MPFFALAISQIAASHLSRPIGLSSMREPTLTLNCFLQALHFHKRRVDRYDTSRPPQFGHSTPLGHRSCERKLVQLSASEKYRIACCKVFGNSLLFFMVEELYTKDAGESSILLPTGRGLGEGLTLEAFSYL